MFQDVPENQLQDEPIDAAAPEEAPAPPPAKWKGWYGVFGLLAIAGGVAAFLCLKPGPATAEANDDAQRTITTFLGTGQKNMTAMQAMLDRTARTVDQFSTSSEKSAELPRNPFAKPQAAADAPVMSEARTQARDRAAKLKLQSIVVSGTRQGCLIDSRYCEAGDVVDGFVIERISGSGVIVREGTFRFELKVQR